MSELCNRIKYRHVVWPIPETFTLIVLEGQIRAADSVIMHSYDQAIFIPFLSTA